MKHHILIFQLLVGSFALSQPCTPTIIELAQDSVNDANIIQTTDGNYLVAGSLAPRTGNSEDLFITKMDLNGNFLWKITQGDSFVTSCPKILETNDGNYLIVYNTEIKSSYFKSSYLLKINNSGTILWKQKIDNSNTCKIEDILEEVNGEILVVGTQYKTKSYPLYPSIAIYKLDAFGKLISKKIFNLDIIEKRQIYNKIDSTYRDTIYVHPGHGHAFKLVKSADGNYLIGAFNLLYPNILPEVGGPLLLKMDSNFNVLWHQNYYHAINKDYPVSIAEESNGNILLGVHEIYQGFDGAIQNLIYRVDSTGVFIKAYSPGPCDNTVHEFRLNQKNQFVIAGVNGISKSDTAGKLISRSYYNPKFKVVLNGRNVYIDHANDSYTLIGIKSRKLCLIEYNYFGDDCITRTKGKVYHDKNRNCQLDSTDGVATAGGLIFGSNCRSINTDILGNYEMESDYGVNYFRLLVNDRYWKIGCENDIANGVQIDYPQFFKDSVNIGFFELDTCFYFEKYFDPSSQKSCSIGKYYYAMNNYGDTTIKNLNLIIDMPSLTSNFTSNHSFTTNGNSLRFTFDSIVKRERISVFIQDSISCNAKVGDTLCYKAKLEFQKSCPVTSTIYLDSICRHVRSSFDPNYIEGYIRHNETCFDGKSYHNLLNYTIHFQNTGNSPAARVIIYDTLGRNLNFNSFKKGNSSHTYTVNQLHDSILIFTFDSINLPDSISDNIASKGLVSFQINGYYSPNLIHQSIEQQASIYFDHNSPVQTPVHILDKCITVGTNDHLDSGHTFIIYPNPGSDHVLVESDLSQYDLHIYNMNGCLILSYRNIQETLHRLDLNHLNQGSYYIQIISGKKSDWKKLILLN